MTFYIKSGERKDWNPSSFVRETDVLRTFWTGELSWYLPEESGIFTQIQKTGMYSRHRSGKKKLYDIPGRGSLVLFSVRLSRGFGRLVCIAVAFACRITAGVFLEIFIAARVFRLLLFWSPGRVRLSIVSVCPGY